MAIVTHIKKRLPAGRQGFTIFFAMLVGSLALAIGLAIYDLTVRELDLSGTATQSQYAIYAADTGAECALYWDSRCTTSACTTLGAGGSAFATSTSSGADPGSILNCNNIDITSPSGSWSVMRDLVNRSATTTFTLTFSPQPYCVTVSVAKSGTPIITTVTAKGYNTCASAGVIRLERVLQVTY